MPYLIKSAQLLFIVSIVMLVARHPVSGLQENETVTDDFDTGTANFWQWLPEDEYPGEDSITFWHLSMHGDPPPFGMETVRPPMEENGGGFLEIVPFSDSPAKIISNVFDLLPGATVTMTYWNVVPFPILERYTVLILYVEFENITQNDDFSTEPPMKTVQVFKAPFPTDPSPGWTTVTIDLPITEPSKVQFRIDGFRRNLTTTGLAVSKISIENGLNVSTTTISTTSMSSTMTQTDSTTGHSTVVSTESSTVTPTKYAVDKTTATTTTTPPTTTTATTPPTTTTATTPPTTTTATTPPTPTKDPVTDEFLTLGTSDPFYTTDESSTASDSTTKLVPSDSSSSQKNTPTSSSSTSPIPTISQAPPLFTLSSSTLNPQMTVSTSSSTISTTISSSNSSKSSSTNPTISTSSSAMSFTISTSSITPSTKVSSSHSSVSSTVAPITPSSPTTQKPSMSTNQLQNVLIGVGVSILLFFLFCLLFTLYYKRQRRRAYLIENRQLEEGIIRVLEQSEQIPSSPHKTESDSSSISSTTASDCPLAPKPSLHSFRKVKIPPK